jgi:hypothetical protein
LTRLRLLLPIAVLVLLAATLAACGSSGDSGGGGEDPNTVLDQTFSGNTDPVKSGDLSLKLDVNVEGDQGGSLNAELSGPFESQGDNKVPKLDFDVSASGSAQGQSLNFDGGLISTGDAAYVNYKGDDYQVDQSLFDRFKQSVEQAAGQQQSDSSPNNAKQLLQQLGIKDPKELLTNLQNDGTSDVEGTETNHISGDLDVDRLVDSLKSLITAQSALGALGGAASPQIPDASQLDQIKGAVKTAHFDLYSGTDDHILRRLTLDLSVEPTSGTTKKVDINFDISFGKVNESQTIEAPSNPKPFSDLLSALGVPAQLLDQLGGGALGNLGGGSSGGTGSSTPSVPDLGGSAQAQQAQKYLQCIAKANSSADLQNCQSLAP